MSLDRQHGEVIFVCDGRHCHDSLITGTHDFGEAITQLRESNWRAKRESNGEWSHYCPLCQTGMDSMSSLIGKL